MSNNIRINKLRHGQEITSEVINNIINEINELASEHAGVIDDKKETTEKLDTFQATLEELEKKYNTKLAGLPNFIELVETYYSQLNDGVNFEYKSNVEEDTGGLSPMYKTDFLLFNDENLCATYRSEHNPPANIKTLLIDTQARIIWFYDLPHLTWISLSANASREAIEIAIPAISIVDDPDSDDYGKWKIGDTITSINALGTEGAIGPQGPMGATGSQGPRGLQGLTGPQGIKGNDGRTIAVIAGSCTDSFGNGFVQNDYTNPYLYIKFYYSDASQAEIDSIKPIIIKTKGIAYVPYIEDGKLYFSIDSNLSNTSEGYNILGQKGDKGDTPKFYFVADGIEKPIEPKPAPEGKGYDFYFDAEQFTGPQGPQGPIGPAGTDGIGIKNIDVVSSTVERCVKITIIKDNEDMKYFEIPYGKDGVDGRDGRDGKDGKDGTPGQNGSDGRNGSDGVGVKSIKASRDTTPNFTKVEIDLTDNQHSEFLVPDGAKGDKGDKGDAGTNGTNGKGISNITSAVTTTGTHLTIVYTDGTVTEVNIPKGEKGDTGATGATGPEGPAGTSLVIAGSVALKSDLPSSATVGTCYIVLTDTSRETTEYGVLYYKTEDGWQYCGQIKGPKGDTGEQGEQGDPGDDGVSITSVSNTSTSGKVKTYTITYSNGNTTQFQVTDGNDGNNGTTPHIDDTTGNWFIGTYNTGVAAKGPQGEKGDTGQGLTIKTSEQAATAIGDGYIATNGHLMLRIATEGQNQWRDCGEIRGPEGKKVLLQKTANYIQWQHQGDSQWINLVSVEDLKGDPGEDGADGEKGDIGLRGKGIISVSSDEIFGGNRITITYESDDPDNPSTQSFIVANGSAGNNGTKVVLIDQATTPNPNDYELNDVIILNAPNNSTVHGKMYRLTITGTVKSWTQITGTMKGPAGETGQRGSQFFKLNSRAYGQTSTSVTKSDVEGSAQVLVGDILIDLNSQMFKVTSTSQTSAFNVYYLIQAQGEKGATGNNGKSMHVYDGATPPPTVARGTYTPGDTVLCLTSSVAKIYKVQSVTASTSTQDDVTYTGGTSIRGVDGRTIKFVSSLPVSSPDPTALYIVRGVDGEQEQNIYFAIRNSTNTAWEYPINFSNCRNINNNYPLTFDGKELGTGPLYSGGTKVTLNGTSKGATTASFFAPTSSGTSGQILESNGSNAAPTWKSKIIEKVNNSTVVGRNIYAPLTSGTSGQSLKSNGAGNAPTWADNFGPTTKGTSGYLWESNGSSSSPSWKEPIISVVNGYTTRGRNIYAPTSSGISGQILKSGGSGGTPIFGYISTLFDIQGLYYDGTSHLNAPCDSGPDYTLYNYPVPDKLYFTPFYLGSSGNNWITPKAGSRTGTYKGIIIFSSCDDNNASNWAGAGAYAFEAHANEELMQKEILQRLAVKTLDHGAVPHSGAKEYANAGLIIWWFNY